MVPTFMLLASSLAVAPAPVGEGPAQEKKNFVVAGKVVTVEGHEPLAGVQVTASTGIGTLLPSAETKTGADGRFRLEFQGRGVAIVSVRKAGWNGRHYGLRPQYLLSEQPLDAKNVSKGYDNLVAGTPAQVEFRMEPAARLKGRLLGGDGKPMAGVRLWLTGEDLPPGASVVADMRTGADGSFDVQDVPRSLYRLVLAGVDGRPDLVLGSIRFRDQAEYAVVATVHEWTPLATHVSFKVHQGPNR